MNLLTAWLMRYTLRGRLGGRKPRAGPPAGLGAAVEPHFI